jgi:hypothetical protein
VSNAEKLVREIDRMRQEEPALRRGRDRDMMVRNPHDRREALRRRRKMEHDLLREKREARNELLRGGL